MKYNDMILWDIKIYIYTHNAFHTSINIFYNLPIYLVKNECTWNHIIQTDTYLTKMMNISETKGCCCYSIYILKP